MIMKKYGIFYGTNSGVTADVAARIGKALGVSAEDIHDVSRTAPSAVGDYSTIILGASTWGDGDVQDDMQDFLNGIRPLDLKGHKIAVFGLGDENMSDTFCNAIGRMSEAVKATGAGLIGSFNTDGYTFSHSTGETAGAVLPGLAIDETNHPEYTDRRIAEWIKLLA